MMTEWRHERTEGTLREAAGGRFSEVAERWLKAKVNEVEPRTLQCLKSYNRLH
jgi:hypothetical protein